MGRRLGVRSAAFLTASAGLARPPRPGLSGRGWGAATSATLLVQSTPAETVFPEGQPAGAGRSVLPSTRGRTVVEGQEKGD